MGETTTIQVTTEQRDELKARKTYDDEPIKSVVGRLLEADDTTGNVDYAEIESRCKRAVEAALPEGRGR